MGDSEKKAASRFAFLFLSFLLAVFLSITSIITVINEFILSSNGVTGSLREVNFHEGAYAQFRSNLSDRLIPTGLPYSVLDGAFTPEEMYEDLNAYVEAMFANDLPNIERDLIAQRLNYNIDNHLAELGLTQADIEYGVIADLIGEIIDNYNDYVSSPLLAVFGRTSNMYAGFLRQIMMAGLAGALITVGIIIFSSRHFRYLSFRYFAFSFGTAALMMMIVPIALRIWGGHHRLGISPEFVLDFIVAHIERSISSFLLVGAIFIVLYVIFITIFARLHRKLQQPQEVSTH